MKEWYETQIEHYATQWQSLIVQGKIKEALYAMQELNNYKLMLARTH